MTRVLSRGLTSEKKLPGAPRVVREEADGALLVVTTDLQITHLHHGAWGGLYPTTLVADDDGSLYIGMRYAIARLRQWPSGMTEEWLVLER